MLPNILAIVIGTFVALGSKKLAHEHDAFQQKLFPSRRPSTERDMRYTRAIYLTVGVVAVILGISGLVGLALGNGVE